MVDQWVPDRRDVICIACNPQAGREMRNFHPFLVLSPRLFNEKTSLVIGLPMTTAAYNADNPFALAVSKHGNRVKTSKTTSYVLCHQPRTFDWRAHGAKQHLQRALADAEFNAVCHRLNQIIQLD